MRSAPRPVLLTAALVVPALLLTACGSSSPVPVVTASADAPATTAADDQPDAPQADPSAAGTTAASSDDAFQQFLDARATLVAYTTSWQGGDLGQDPTFQRLRADLVAAKGALHGTDGWQGDYATATGGELQISADQAVQIGQDRIGSAVPVREIDLDTDENRLLWEIEFRSGDLEHTVVVDATTGDVLEHEVDD